MSKNTRDTDADFYVETPTEYDEAANSSYPIELLIEEIGRDDATYLAQQLSLFVETNDAEALVRFGKAVTTAACEDTKSTVRQRFEDGSDVGGLRWDSDVTASIEDSDSWVLTFDGASRGNPGEAAIGVTLSREGHNKLLAHSERIGTATNNVAEYKALIAGLELVSEFHPTSLHVQGDTELVVRQVTGEYRTNEKLTPYLDEVRELLFLFSDVSFEHILRGENENADKLAADALEGNPTTLTP